MGKGIVFSNPQSFSGMMRKNGEICISATLQPVESLHISNHFWRFLVVLKDENETVHQIGVFIPIFTELNILVPKDLRQSFALLSCNIQDLLKAYQVDIMSLPV